MSDTRPPRVYFDSSVYIAHFLDESSKGDVADALRDALDTGTDQ